MDRAHVFLSYCHDDAADVTLLHDELVAGGENVWRDREIKGGQDWKHEIRKAIKSAYAIVICLSERVAARKTSGLFPEALDAIELYREYVPGSIFMIPVRLSRCEIPAIAIDATRALDSLQYIDLWPAAKRAAGVEKLFSSIRSAPHHP